MHRKVRKGDPDMSIGSEIYSLADRIFPICRSITGKGVVETLDILNDWLRKGNCPEMNITNVPTGTPVFDWTVPKEWRITSAYIENEAGEHIIDFKDHPLHVLGYSAPVDEWVDLEELKKHVYVQDDMPDAIPYVTSYYKERYGFCMTKNMYDSLPEGKYHMFIDSELFEGNLTYADLVIPGKSEKEVFFSSYVCHPHMANNEASGPALLCELIKYVCGMKDRRYSYRFYLGPETIGSITYLSKNISVMQKNIIAGFNLSCVGDNRTYSIVESRYADTYADRVLINILEHRESDYKRYSFLKRGSDEREYCAPGVDLPVVTFCRSKYVEYPEYHTSKDDMSLVSTEGFEGAYEVMTECISLLENNGNYCMSVLCEPQLGKRGLYPDISKKGSYDAVQVLRDFIAYADGRNDLIGLSDIIGVPVSELIPIKNKLLENDLIKDVAE